MGRHLETVKLQATGGAPPLTIRAMVNRDIRHFSLLFQQIFSKPPWNEEWTLDAIRDLAWKIMRRDGYIGTVAEYASRPVGYAIGYDLFRLPFLPRLFYLDHLFVDEAYRGIGIGGGLLSKIAEIAIIRKESKIVLMTKKNSAAETLYLGEGYLRVLPIIKIQQKIVLWKKLR
jgi:GNAT superfamily N-acetyltransferase